MYPDAAAEVAEGLDLRVELVQYGLLVQHVEGDVQQRVLTGEEILPMNQRVGVKGVVLHAQLTIELEAAVAAELEIPLHIHRPAFRYHQRHTVGALPGHHGEARADQFSFNAEWRVRNAETGADSEHGEIAGNIDGRVQQVDDIPSGMTKVAGSA